MGQHFPVIIVTGLSGSGKSTALNVFEDMGFVAVDGLPVSFAPQVPGMFTSGRGVEYKGLVFGMDLRRSEFIADYHKALEELQEQGVTPQLVFLEAQQDVLLKRYAATRRPHPLEREGVGLERALTLERSRMQPLRDSADLVIDSSFYSVHDLRRALQEKWQTLEQSARALRLHLTSFGFKYGAPADADMMFDLRFLPNPYFVPELKPLSGKDAGVSQYVLGSTVGAAFFAKLQEFLNFTFEQNEQEGRFRLSVAIGCTGGRHRSVAMVEALAAVFRQKHYAVSVEHRHLELG